MVVLVSHRRAVVGRVAVTLHGHGPIVPLLPSPLAWKHGRGLWSRIGGRRAAVFRGKGGLVFQLGRQRWPLADVSLEHRDRDGEVEFRVLRGKQECARLRYRRKGPTSWDLFWSQIDVTSDEPWTWEDSDFGLLAFHVATGTGPIKWRHYLMPATFAIDDELPPQSLVVDEEGLSREFRGFPGGQESIRWRDLTEIRAKFEITGIWSDPTLLILRGGNEQVVIPIFNGVLDAALRERLVALPGFGSRSEAALNDALDYARGYGYADRSISWEELRSRAERSVWTRSDDLAAAAQPAGSQGGSYR